MHLLSSSQDYLELKTRDLKSKKPTALLSLYLEGITYNTVSRIRVPRQKDLITIRLLFLYFFL